MSTQWKMRDVKWTFLSFLAGAFCVGLPQNVASASLTPMAQHFGLSERDKDIVLGGWMALAFFILGAPMSVLINVLARDMNRRSLLLSLSVAAAASALVSAGAQHVWHLVAARAALGAATSALQPLMACVLGDLYPPPQRAAMASYVSLSTGGGAVVGQILAGGTGSVGVGPP